MARSTWLRVLGCFLVMALALGMAACGDDEPIGATEVVGEDTIDKDGNPELYCELVSELEDAGREAFKEVEQNKKATNADFKKAERDFVEGNQQTLDALIEAGPAEIGQDVRTLIDSIRGRAGLGPKVPQKEATAAEKNIQAYEKENC